MPFKDKAKKAAYDKNREKTRVRDQKGRKGGAHSAALRPFVAIDSEGMNFGAPQKLKDEIRQRHKSVLWMAATVDGQEHATYDRNSCYGPCIWHWLTSLNEVFPKNSIFVIFAGSYDFTQILADLPFHQAENLASEMRKGVDHWTRCGDYGFRYVRGKRFSIARYGGFDPERNCVSWHHKVTIYDVWGFFQTSFLKALAGFPGLCSEADLKILTEGKENRSNFTEWDIGKIKEYTRKELHYLAKMMHALRDGLDAMHLQLAHWSGAGSIAGALLKAQNVKQHIWPMRTDLKFKPVWDYEKQQEIDPELDGYEGPQMWGHYAYFGGRIEVLKSGITKSTLHVYDIASAYPHIARLLPSMEGGHFVYHETAFSQQIRRMSFCSMVYISFRWKKRETGYYPLPWRKEDKGIVFPIEGRGVYMVDEYLAAVEWMSVYGGEINVLGVYEFIPAQDPPLAFGFVPDLFNQRAEMVEGTKKGKPYDIREKVIKLGLNSIYGKMAQRVGGHGRAPAYSCIFYAAAITAGTRAMLIRATIPQMSDIVQFATDGIVSTKPLKLEVPAQKELGAWECDKVKGGTFVMSGLYAYGKVIKTRGFGAKSINRPIDEFFTKECPAAWENGVKEIAFDQQRYETFGRAVASKDRWNIAGYWLTALRKIDISGAGSKRMGVKPDRHSGLRSTGPFNLGHESFMSSPILPEWLDEDDEGGERDNAEQKQIQDGME